MSIYLPEIEYYIEYKIPAVAKHIDTWEILMYNDKIAKENITVQSENAIVSRVGEG